MPPFVTIKPTPWPQDDLNIPDGMGGMPPVESGNFVSGQEFFAISGRVVIAAATAAGNVSRLALNTPQDGDFWCDAIGVVSWEEDVLTPGAQDNQHFLAAMVSIRDIRTGRDLIFNRGLSVGAGANVLPINSVPINLFRKLPQSGTEAGADYNGNTPAPSGFRSTGTLIQPFCFTRQGGIELTMTTLFAAPAGKSYDVSFGFTGWKEYAHASR